eukprot:42327-Pyramimonas_sp.AAC.1
MGRARFTDPFRAPQTRKARQVTATSATISAPPAHPSPLKPVSYVSSIFGDDNMNIACWPALIHLLRISPSSFLTQAQNAQNTLKGKWDCRLAHHPQLLIGLLAR